MRFNDHLTRNFLLSMLIFLSALSCTTRQKMANYDVSYIYHPAKTTVKNKILATKDSLIIFLSYYNPFDYNTLPIKDFAKNYKFIYKVTHNHYSSEVILSDSILLNEKDITYHQRTFYFSFKIPRLEISPALLMIYKKDIKRNRIEVTDIPIDFSMNYADKNYIFINKKNHSPAMGNYLIKNDTVVIKSVNESKDSLFVYHYNHRFSPASTPISQAPSSKKNTLDIDTTYWTMTDMPLTFSLNGLYFIQKDTNSNVGISIFVADNKFPKLSRAEEMIEPLCYLTTKEEQDRMEASVHPKETLDSFWLKIGGSKEYSKELIKSFYQKVEYSNKVFTTYKEGWKTDQGVIYIIFGKPDQVFKWGEKEEWVYENILTQIVTFTFLKNPNIFSDEHYELIRNPEYERYWDLTIEKWKNGIITK